MFEIIKAIVLGIVQGATEFLPVSSSGHLVIVPWLLGWQPGDLLFDTILHWGTLVSIALVFWADFVRIIRATLTSLARRSLADPNARLGWWIVLATIPAAASGLLLKDSIEELFHSPVTAGTFLFVTAALLLGSEWLARRGSSHTTLNRLSLADAILIGLAQAVALAPGISRSGSTIAAGLARGLRRDEAARFSFLLGTPAFLGAGLLQLADVLGTDPSALTVQAPALLAGFVASAIAGLVAIRFLLAYLRRRTLYPFAFYCIALGIVVLLVNGLQLRY
ncbi:MAG: undecaprenyl-diphosphatase UppP [Chloroflexi bacterium]|nr:undecaprenyl-diphosphatase UppP [Chloroflexota bacterium]